MVLVGRGPIQPRPPRGAGGGTSARATIRVSTHVFSGGRMRIAPILFLCAALLVTSCGTPSAPAGAPGGSSAGGGSSAAPKRLTIAIRSDPKALTAKLNSAAGAGGSPGAPEIEQMLNSGLGVET